MSTRPRYMAVPIGSVLPTGWRGFGYIGAKGNVEQYRCQQCGAEVHVETDRPPVLAHGDCQQFTPAVEFRERGAEGGVF